MPTTPVLLNFSYPFLLSEWLDECPGNPLSLPKNIISPIFDGLVKSHLSVTPAKAGVQNILK
jgi:hypothetical protein